MKTQMNPLLKQYAESGDQQAFGQLVEAHINIAYSAALACLGREDLARDACQLTFLELSKKAAKLSEAVQLGGWVHRTAYNVARKIQRAEIRRYKREQRYADDMNTHHQSEPDWANLSPEIHAALNELNALDREAIILRFFQEKSLAEVGSALDLSADAARMLLKRALEQLNGQLSRKGIASTAGALAAALPAHAFAAAPLGLSATVSTAVLAGAGWSSLTLTGVILTTMKAKAVIISSVVVASAVIGTGVYRSIQTHEPTVNKEQVQDASVTADTNLQRRAAESRAGGIPKSAGKITRAVNAAAAPQVSPLVSSAGSDTLGISQADLEDAEKKVSMMQALAPLLSETMTKEKLQADIENPSAKLKIRLQLDPETVARLNKILSDHADKEAVHLSDSMSQMVKVMTSMLESDRDGMVKMTALEAMQDAGKTLSDEQQAYLNERKEMANAQMDEGFSYDDVPVPQQWFENDAVVNQMLDQLSEPQQTELLTHVEEQKTRKKERIAYDRSSMLANSLGLNEGDRIWLYDYLYKHPDATNADITKQLDPELHELMPKSP